MPIELSGDQFYDLQYQLKRISESLKEFNEAWNLKSFLSIQFVQYFFSNIEKDKKLQLRNFGVCAFLQVVANHICKSFCTENVRCEKSESSTEATETWYKEKLENNLMCDSQKHCGATLCL